MARSWDGTAKGQRSADGRFSKRRPSPRLTPWHGIRHTLAGMRGRTIDRNYRQRVKAPAMVADEIWAGLANGAYVRGVTRRTASGEGAMPVVGDLLLPGQVDVEPPLGSSQTAAAWEVTGLGRAHDGQWMVPVVGIRER